MRPILRKLRGALGTALTWAVGWAVGGFALATLLYMTTDAIVVLGPFWEVAPGVAFRFGLYGLMGGALFAGALSIIHGRRTLGELKPAWVGLWGGLAGVLVSIGVLGVLVASGLAIPWSLPMFGGLALVASFYGGLGAATAVGTIMLAQGGGKEIESSDPRAAIENPWRPNRPR